MAGFTARHRRAGFASPAPSTSPKSGASSFSKSAAMRTEDMSKVIIMAGDNRLVVLAADIRELHNQQLVDLKSIGERAIIIGNMLIEAKAAVAHGQWLPWLAQTGLGERTAQRYMRLAKHGIKPDTVTDLGLNRTLASLSAGPLDFDMPGPGECLWLIVGPIKNDIAERLAWIWPDQRTDLAGFYWLVMVD